MSPLPRSILITGASSGLGAALAAAYAKPGVTLHLTGRNADRLAATCQAVVNLGAIVYTWVGDVTDAQGLAAWILEQDQIAPLDLVIANAGISAGPRDGLETPAQIQVLLATNIQGVMNTIQPAIDRMRGRARGQIALMSSLAGFAPWPGAPTYAASKAYLKNYGLALRLALKQTGIQVNVICPGFVDTPMTRVNPYFMPFLIDADRAATLMVAGLAANRAVIAFPWPTALMARLLGALPFFIQARILAYAPEKPVLPDKTSL